MTPLKASLEIDITVQISYDVPNLPINSIIVTAFGNRQTSGLEYLDDAKVLIENYLKSNEIDLLNKINETFGHKEFVKIEDIEVKLEGRQYFGNHPQPEFWGTYTFYAKSEEIGIVQILPDRTIAYYSDSLISLRFVQLSKSLTCAIHQELL